jgi:hypothetical protein
MQALARFLRAIPQSNQPAQRLDVLAAALSMEAAHLYGIAQMLRLFGIVTLTPDKDAIDAADINAVQIQASSQAAKYTLNSLAAYADDGQQIVTDWQTRGLQDDLLANGASFLGQLDAQRLRLSDDPQPSRVQAVAQVIIKRTNPQTGQPELLFQWDEAASQYQLIGGRKSDDDPDMLTTIQREISEELPGNSLQYGTDYDLKPLLHDQPTAPTVSRTFGALTQYRFTLYLMTALRQAPVLSADDAWIRLQDAQTGQMPQPATGSMWRVAFEEIVDMLRAAGIAADNLPDSL